VHIYPGKSKFIPIPQHADNIKLKLFQCCNHSDNSVQEKQAAAKQLDLAIKTTPWALTDNYVSRERENRGSQVAFAGPGDPTGKGRGFSFVKDTRRVCTVTFQNLHLPMWQQLWFRLTRMYFRSESVGKLEVKMQVSPAVLIQEQL